MTQTWRHQNFPGLKEGTRQERTEGSWKIDDQKREIFPNSRKGEKLGLIEKRLQFLNELS